MPSLIFEETYEKIKYSLLIFSFLVRHGKNREYVIKRDFFFFISILKSREQYDFLFIKIDIEGIGIFFTKDGIMFNYFCDDIEIALFDSHKIRTQKQAICKL